MFTHQHPLSTFERATLWHLVHQYFEEPLVVDLPLHTAPNIPDELDIRIAERLINIFHSMNEFEQSRIRPEDRPNSGIWEMSKHEFHGDAYRMIFSGDVVGFARYMANAMREKITHGLGPGEFVFNAIAKTEDGCVSNIVLLLDRISRLAEAVGAQPHENPEQGRYGKNIRVQYEELIAGISQNIGMDIARPAVMGNFGLKLGNSVIDPRVPDDVYTAFRMRRIADQFSLSRPAEIGGGLGGLALQSIRAGFSDYQIFDLPIINLVQGYFLMRTLGPDAVRMFGESHEGRLVHILPYWEFRDPQNAFDFVVNRDSLPEIPLQQAEEYIDEIVGRKAPLLSINQESAAEAGQPGLHQLSVMNLFATKGRPQSLYRCPYWIRRGYVEELFLP